MVRIVTTVERIVTETGSDTSDPVPLDQIFATRSHVRVLRAMVIKDPGTNVGARDVARLSGVSHPRASQVLRELARAGLVIGHETRWGTVFELNDEHFLSPQLWALFDDELHVLQEIDGYVRGEARKSRRALRVRIEHGLDRDVEVVLASDRQFGPEDHRWFRDLEDGILHRFGLEVRVAARDPNEWLLTL